MQSNCHNLESHRRVVPTTRNSVKEFAWLAGWLPLRELMIAGAVGCSHKKNPATWHSHQALTMADHWHVSIMLCTYLGPAQPSQAGRHGTTRDSCSAADVNMITKSLYPCDQISQFSSRAHHTVIILFQQWFHWPQGCIVRVYASVLPCRLSCSPPIQFPFFI